MKAKNLIIFVAMAFFLTAMRISALQWEPLTKQQAQNYLSHAPQDQVVTIVQNYDTLMNGTPSISGPNIVAVLEKDGTLQVYWTSPDTVISWSDPNDATKTLLQLKVPLPSLTQKNFYKAPPYPINDVLTAGGVGLVVGVVGTLISMLVMK